MEIVKANEIEKNKHFTALIYGQAGMGKTTTLSSLKGRTLILDVDGSSFVLAGCENIDVVKMNPKEPHKEFGEFYKYVLKHQNEYDNVVIDNLSHFSKLWLIERSKHTKSGQPELRDYGLLDNLIVEAVSAYKNLDLNVVFTAWEVEKEITMDSGRVYNKFYPDLRDKIINNVMGIIPIVARLVTDSEGERIYALTATLSTYAKNQYDDRQMAKQLELFKF
ncbi:phage nucleotide-binding protein [Pilibacter termitis]|uniref:Phage nucleotide-binding protein n=1 Tax=Pilibacter termitis TaxID=263852 RepID=A0A1T4RCF5_9ENTE|nr:AAA family ATPase [Pilibacter termitis]SKA13623.1 phage nucleotide-binding protein [Pilibacter termitis]